MQYIFKDIFYCRHLARGFLAKITVAASQITKRINTIVFVSRALQVFIAREVNKTSIFIYMYSSVAAVLVIAFKGCGISTVFFLLSSLLTI